MAPKKKQSLLAFSGSPTPVAEEQPEPKRRKRNEGKVSLAEAASAALGRKPPAKKKEAQDKPEPQPKAKRTRKQAAPKEGTEEVADAKDATAAADATPPAARERATPPASPTMGPATIEVIQAELDAAPNETMSEHPQVEQSAERKHEDKPEKKTESLVDGLQALKTAEQDGIDYHMQQFRAEDAAAPAPTETLAPTEPDTQVVGVADMKEDDLFGSQPEQARESADDGKAWSQDRQPSFEGSGIHQPSLGSMIQQFQGDLTQSQAEIHQELMRRFEAGESTTGSSTEPASPATTATSWTPLSRKELKAQAEEECGNEDLAALHMHLPNKCAKCHRALENLKTVLKGKQRPTLVCCFCNRSSVMLQRHLNWPTTHFTGLSLKAQEEFWANCADAQIGEDGADNGLKYGRLRGILKKTLTRERITEYQTSEGGEFQPLGFYASKGISAAIIPLRRLQVKID